MKSLILTVTAAAFLSTLGSVAAAGVLPAGFHGIDKVGVATVEKRRKPRVPGGSGCDDPRDLIEHPECAG